MREVKLFFNSYADDFDAIYGTNKSLVNNILNPILRKSMRIRFEKTIQYTDPVIGKTVLDVGCGPGHYAIELAKKGAEKVTGIDFSDEMINIAREKARSNNVNDKCNFIVKDIFEYNVKEKYNYSVVMGVMDYINNPNFFIFKLISLTTEKIFFSFPASDGILALQRRIRYLNRCPLYMYNEKELNKLFEKFQPHQYKIEKIHRDFFVTLTIM